MNDAPLREAEASETYQVRLEVFAGPLDLLLFLIRKKKIDIHNIPIAVITKEYLEYLDREEQINLDRETGVWDKDRMLHYCRKLQAAGRGIILNGELSEAELEEFRAALKPEGLEFYYWNP